MRMVKDADEIDALRQAAHAVDAIAADMRLRPFAGAPNSTCTASSSIASSPTGTNARTSRSSRPARTPRARTTSRRPTGSIGDGDLVLCDFGGTMKRLLLRHHTHVPCRRAVGEVRDVYAVLLGRAGGRRASRHGRDAVRSGRRRRASSDRGGGFRRVFIHRVGHGIGSEAHEDPYMVSGNAPPLVAGHTFSVEPGIYFPGRFGMRLEDIVVATADGPVRLNEAARDLASCLVDDGARRRHVPAATGCGRPVLLLDHDPPARGQPRLRLAVAQHVRIAGGRRRRHPARQRHVAGASRVGERRWRRPSRSGSRVVRAARACTVEEALRAERKERVAAMIGRREADTGQSTTAAAAEFPPVLDSSRRSFGFIALLVAAEFAGGPYALAAARLIVGAVFLGAVSDAMLLGHWYLVQPGLRREPLKETRDLDRDDVAVRDRGVPLAGRRGAGVQRHRRRRLRRCARLDVDRVRDLHDRARRGDVDRVRRSATTPRSWPRPACCTSRSSPASAWTSSPAPSCP